MASPSNLREEILVLGDSHVGIFSDKIFVSEFAGKHFNVVSVGGATISGLKNPNSVTQAMTIFQNNIKKTNAKLCIVSLGEVDTGFVIWYRAEKNNISVEEAFNTTIANYTTFLENLSNKFKLICISSPLPTIRDNQNWGGVANARKDVKATQKQRTELTLKFNKAIGNFCTKNNIAFVSLDEKVLDENGTLRLEFYNPSPTDHHYNPKTYSRILISELKNIIK